jgi:tRNA U34 5-methylaminomethyl-2-thiouridine-forming methyltransferase MnmC
VNNNSTSRNGPHQTLKLEINDLKPMRLLGAIYRSAPSFILGRQRFTGYGPRYNGPVVQHVAGIRSCSYSTDEGAVKSQTAATTWTPVETGDGSFTFYSTDFEQTFHNIKQGAKAEAFYKFVCTTNLASLAKERDEICLVDVCYGLGYNAAVALDAVWEVNPDCHVTLYALELDPTVPLGALTPDMLLQWSPQVQRVLQDLAHQQNCELTGTIGNSTSSNASLDATLLLGDARNTIQSLADRNVQADAIFLDPFSPRSCPQLWSVEFLQLVAKCLAPKGTLATYSFSASVRAALIEAGLQVGTIPPSGKYKQQDGIDVNNRKRYKKQWSQGTVGVWNEDDHASLIHLSPMEREHLQTRAAIPFRDPSLADNAPAILKRQKEEQLNSTFGSTSQFFKRWGMK